MKCQDFLLPSFRDKNGILIRSSKNVQRGVAAAWEIFPYSASTPASVAESPTTFMKKTKRNEISWLWISFYTLPTPQEKRRRTGVRDSEFGSVEHRQHTLDIPMFGICIYVCQKYLNDLEINFLKKSVTS